MAETERPIYKSDVVAAISRYVGALSAWLQVRDVDHTPDVITDVIRTNLHEKQVDLVAKLLNNPQWIRENMEIFLRRLENGVKGEVT